MAIEEEVFYEGGPHVGDLIIGIILLFFVITIPLGIGAISRALWVRYRISSRRISVTSGWRGNSRIDVVYAEIAKVVTVPRGLGGWGDMVLTLKDGSRFEMRSVPKFRQAYEFIEQRLSLKAQQVSGALGGSQA